MTASKGPSPRLLQGGATVSGVASLGLGTRAKNVLNSAGIRTIAEVANLDAERILELRNIGEQTFQEIARALMKVSVKPEWLEIVATRFRYSDAVLLTPEIEAELERGGWHPLSWPCDRKEQWILEQLIFDMQNRGTDYRLYRTHEGGPITIFRQGGTGWDDGPEE